MKLDMPCMYFLFVGPIKMRNHYGEDPSLNVVFQEILDAGWVNHGVQAPSTSPSPGADPLMTRGSQSLKRGKDFLLTYDSS